MQTIFIGLGLRTLILSGKTLMVGTTAMLSQRMFEINRLELEHPSLFACLSLPEAEDCSCVEDEMRMQHYLFMLFSFYEQLVLLKDASIADYQNSWRWRFLEHMSNRPKFRHYWETRYKRQCTSTFKRFVVELLAEPDNKKSRRLFGYRLGTR